MNDRHEVKRVDSQQRVWPTLGRAMGERSVIDIGCGPMGAVGGSGLEGIGGVVRWSKGGRVFIGTPLCGISGEAMCSYARCGAATMLIAKRQERKRLGYVLLVN